MLTPERIRELWSETNGMVRRDSVTEEQLNAFARTIERECATPPAEAPAASAGQSAKRRYDELGVDADETDPVERLRAFCSLSMSGQDWLDVEPFFDAVIVARSSSPVEAGAGEVVAKPSVESIIALLQRAVCEIPAALATEVWQVTPLQVMWVIGMLRKGLPDTAPQAGASPEDALNLAIALEQQRALHIVAAVRQQGFAKSASAIPTQAESVFDLACEEIEHRLRTEVWELNGVGAPLLVEAGAASLTAEQFKDALHSHFNEFPIPTQLGVTAVMKHIERVYAALAASDKEGA